VKPLNILHLLPDFSPSGMRRRLLGLLPEFLARGWNSHCLALHDSGAWKSRFVSHATTCAGVSTRRNDPLLFLKLTRDIRKLRPEVIHFWGEFPAWIDLLCRCVIPQARYFATLNSLASPPASLGSVPHTRFVAWRACGLSKVILESSALEQFFREHLSAQLIAKVRRMPAALPPAALPPAALTPAALPLAALSPAHATPVLSAGSPVSTPLPPEFCSQYHLPPTARCLLAIGPWTHSKNCEDLLWALDQVNCLLPNVFLLVVGTGPALEKARKYSRLFQIDQQVRWLGYQESLAPYWAHASIYVSAAVDLDTSQSILEALAAGLPIVARDTPANRELLRHVEHGYLIPASQRAEFARHILLILEQSELAARLSQACETRAANFAQRWSAYVESYCTLYNSR
jgi:glycosyltransferase involved in cell wall biosynthesis